MADVTVSTKVGREVVEKIAQTGFSISEVMQVGLDVFLNLASEEQKDLILRHYKNRMLARALSKHKAIVKSRESNDVNQKSLKKVQSC